MVTVRKLYAGEAADVSNMTDASGIGGRARHFRAGLKNAESKRRVCLDAAREHSARGLECCTEASGVRAKKRDFGRLIMLIELKADSAMIGGQGLTAEIAEFPKGGWN